MSEENNKLCAAGAEVLGREILIGVLSFLAFIFRVFPIRVITRQSSIGNSSARWRIISRQNDKERKGKLRRKFRE